MNNTFIHNSWFFLLENNERGRENNKREFLCQIYCDARVYFSQKHGKFISNGIFVNCMYEEKLCNENFKIETKYITNQHNIKQTCHPISGNIPIKIV